MTGPWWQRLLVFVGTTAGVALQNADWLSFVSQYIPDAAFAGAVAGLATWVFGYLVKLLPPSVAKAPSK